jgi:NhaA family Na+:H+ antiporter
MTPTSSPFADFLRSEENGGRFLLIASAVALLWANLAGDSYESFWDTHTSLGPGWLHLDLTLGDWAADGLLALFFFIAGMEVKRELVVGELSNRKAAMLPVFAAVGGMVVPALIAIAISGGAAAEGGAWAVPVATDIAFALGVLALVASALPPGVRVLLLSVAVVDDLIAIALIAVVFTDGIDLGWLAGGLVACGLYFLAFRNRLDRAALLWLLAAGCWVCIHASGVHATVAGILLGLLTPVRPRPGETAAASARIEHRVHPVSAAVCVPIFALAAAGIPLGAAGDAAMSPIALGIFFGLLVGKFVGVLGGARLAIALRVGALPAGLAWRDALPVGLLAGIGYTVSLLIARLAFESPQDQEQAAAAVLVASVVASLLAVVLLRRRGGAGTVGPRR